MIDSALATTTTNLALLPGFLDPVNLLNSFGTWMLAGLLLVVFIESGLLFPLLPGDSLLFTAGLIVAAKSAEIEPFAPLWVLLVLIPIAAHHFHKAGLYGALANLVAIPLTTFVIMPAEAAALLLDPVGLGAPFWVIAGGAIGFLLDLAHWVSRVSARAL